MRELGKYLAMATMAMATGSAFAQEPANSVPTITITPTSNGIEVVGSAVGLSRGKATGTLTIERHGRSGTARTRQSRELDLGPGETAYIARTGVSFGAGDTLDVTVTLEQDGQIIGTATVKSRGD